MLRLMVDINWVASKYHRNIYCASTGWMVNDAVFQCILGLVHTSMETSSLSIFLLHTYLAEVPFHRITSSYSYFEEFEFLRKFSKKQNMTEKNISWTEIKSLLTKPRNVFTHHAKIQICCTVKLIPWTVISQSHLY